MIEARDRHLLTKGKTFAIPNFTEEAEMLEWAGINFGEDNTLRLSKSIKVSSLLFVSKMTVIILTIGILLCVEIGNYEWS